MSESKFMSAEERRALWNARGGAAFVGLRRCLTEIEHYDLAGAALARALRTAMDRAEKLTAALAHAERALNEREQEGIRPLINELDRQIDYISNQNRLSARITELETQLRAAEQQRDEYWVDRLTALGLHPGLSLEENIRDLIAHYEAERSDASLARSELAAAEQQRDAYRDERAEQITRSEQWAALLTRKDGKILDLEARLAEAEAEVTRLRDVEGLAWQTKVHEAEQRGRELEAELNRVRTEHTEQLEWIAAHWYSGGVRHDGFIRRV